VINLILASPDGLSRGVNATYSRETYDRNVSLNFERNSLHCTMTRAERAHKRDIEEKCLKDELSDSATVAHGQEVVDELARHLGVERLDAKTLVDIATTLSMLLPQESRISRQEKRYKKFRLGWFARNSVEIRPFLSRIVVLTREGAYGPYASFFTDSTNWEPSLAEYFNDDSD
jgi:hypothetical protein